MTHLKLALAATAAMSLTLVFFARSETPTPVASPLFDQTFEDVTMLKKSDRFNMTVEPIPVKIEAIPVTTDKVEDKPKITKKEHNTCTRHGMRKVSYRGGRSWRCKR
jgi:hypothetical protein